MHRLFDPFELVDQLLHDRVEDLNKLFVQQMLLFDANGRRAVRMRQLQMYEL